MISNKDNMAAQNSVLGPIALDKVRTSEITIGTGAANAVGAIVKLQCRIGGGAWQNMKLTLPDLTTGDSLTGTDKAGSASARGYTEAQVIRTDATAGVCLAYLNVVTY